MPKVYSFITPEGQRYDNVQEHLVAEFMETYPGSIEAEVMETEDPITTKEAEEQYEEVIPILSEEDNLSDQLSKYDSEAKQHKTKFDNAFDSMSQRDEYINNLSEQDKKHIENEEWAMLSEDAMGGLLSNVAADKVGYILSPYQAWKAGRSAVSGEFDAIVGDLPIMEILRAPKQIYEIANTEDTVYEDKEAGAYKKELNQYLANREKNVIPTDFLDSDLGSNLIGHQEEEVTKTLQSLYKGYGFDFEETGAFTDNVIVRTKDGKNEMVISLDNWTDEGDREEAKKLKNFLDTYKQERAKDVNPRQYIDNLAASHTNLDEAVSMKQGNWDLIKKQRGITDEEVASWDNDYREDIINNQTAVLNNSVIDLNKNAALLEAETNSLANEVTKLQQGVTNGTISKEDALVRHEELETLQADLKLKAENLNITYEKDIVPLQGALNIIAGKQHVIKAEQGNILTHTLDIAGDVLDSFADFGNVIELSTLELRNAVKGIDSIESKKIVDERFNQIKSDIKFTDTSNEYAQEFDNSIAGGVYRAGVEMVGMMSVSALAGPAAPVVYGTLMGLNIAGNVVEEMDEIEGISQWEKLGMATMIGTVNGALEAVGAKYTKVLAPGGVTGVTKSVMMKALNRVGTKGLTKASLQKVSTEILEEGLKKGTYKIIGNNIVEGVIGEGLTEVSQTAAETGIKGLYNIVKGEEKFQNLAEQVTLENLAKTFTIGGITGGAFGGFSGVRNAWRTKSTDRLENRQFLFARELMRDKNFMKQYSAKLMTEVRNPDSKMTMEQAQNHLRDLKAWGGVYQQVSGLGLTTEGEKRAFTLIQRKGELQKQIDGVSDKALVKKQREEITEIDKKLEVISLTENFETAYQRGLQETKERQEASNKGFTIYKTDEEFKAKMKEFGEEDIKVVNGKKIDEGFKGTSGYISATGDVFINDAAARRLKDISVGQHELLHAVTAKQLQGKGQAFKDQLILDFKKQLPKEQLKILDAEVTGAYGENATSEEYFNKFVDLVVSGEIKQDENIFTKIGDWITTNILKPLGFKQASFKNGKEVYRFIKGYAKQSRAIAKGTQKSFTGDIGDIVSEGSGVGTEGQMSRQVPVVKGVDPKQVQTMIDKVANRAWTRFGKNIPKNIAEKAGLTRRSYIDSAKSELGLIAEKFDASKAEFDRYMANTGMQRLNSLAAKLGVEDARKGVSTKSIDSEQARQIEAEEDTYVDKRSEKEIRQTERKGVKVRKRIPKVYDVDTVVESIRKKAKGKDFKGKSIKQLKGFALKEVVDMIARDDADLAESLMKKLDKNSDLNKGEMLAIQNFINADTDLAIGSLLEGYTSEFKATGVVNKLLEKFYNKRSIRAKTGPGLNVQIKKPNINPTEFKEAFGIIGKDKSKWNQKVPASKGGVSDILKGFVRNFDQVISSQEIREQLIQDGKPVEALRTLADGIPSGYFSKTAKNLDLIDQIALVEILISDKFLNDAEVLRTSTPPNSEWLATALRGAVDKDFRKRFNLTPAKLRTIGNELQQEFDPKKSWKEYVKKAVDIQIDEAKIGMYSTLKQIAKARGFNIETGTGAYSDLKKLNKLRLEISNLLQDLKQEGVSDSDISKYILPALVGSYKMGSYKLKNNRIPPSAILQDSDILIDEGTPRQGIYGSSTDANANADVDSKDKISGQIHKHKSWYIKPLSRVQQKEYGVKNFDDLPLNKRGEFIKKEIQPEGLRAKEVLDKVTDLMAQLVKDNKLSPQTASIFIDLQFARMDGLGKLASDVRFIPFNTRSELMSLFDLAKNDDFVLEHTIPGNRIKLAMYNAVLGGDKASMELFKKDLAEYHSAIIPKAFDNLVNRKDGKELYLRTAPAIRQAGDFALSETGRYADSSRFPMSLYDVDTKENYGEPIQLEQGVEQARELNNELALSSKVQEPATIGGSFSKTNTDIISDFINMDEALSKANAMDQPVKKARVFDFDDTVARTKSNVLYTMPDGRKGKLTAEEFAKQGDSILKEGGEFDFSEFNKVMDGKKGPLFDLMKKMKEAEGDRDIFILTARAPEAAPAIQQFLKEMGVDIPLKNITGLGDSSGKAKAQWIVNKAAEGYNDFYFADDAAQNVKAVRDALEVLDVKSKVQQARLGKFSKQVNKEFNDIIQESTGEPADTTYSTMRAKMMGGKKGRFKFFIPYSAEDFMGLIYPLLGKGKAGDQHMKWFKEMLLDPFAKANAAISASRLQLMEDFKALKENLNIAKNLQEKGPLGFTNEQAVRVYIWAMQGMKIEGLSDKEVQTLINHVQGDSDLRLFSQELINITKGDGYAKPGKNWLAGTITTDLMETLNTVKRAKYLQQWQNNVDVIFSEENLNKLEALYGTKYREALENSLSRMKSGKNRLASGNRLSNKILDYINGSVGAIMFLNIRSAVLQTISSINFVNWTDNNPLKAGAAFANQSQYWSDFMTLVNSDFLKDRRQGLKLNINEAEIANAAKTSKNKAKAALNYILEKGYAPTKFADSFAIASGGATFYRNRINTYLKEGKSEREAKAQALQDFREIAEESQQSSRPDKISSQQSSDLGRIILAFANTPMQYARLQKRAFQDLVNGRGDAKSNVSKIIYYGFVQNLIFNALQQAVFALGFGDDDEEKEKEKIINTANGMADSLLRGLGVGGVTASIIKNFLLDIYERSGRPRPEYSDSVFELIKFSPPISSKISKLRGAAWAFDSKKRRQEIIDKGFALDNPAYESFAKVITATTNAPLDRLYLKLNNIEAALSEEADLWQSVAMIAGWPEWIIMPKPKVKNKKKKKNKKGGYRKTNLRIGGKQGKRKTTLRL
jgi:hypothetical protein